MRAVLTGEHPVLTKRRDQLKHIPSNPRCKLCAAPFAGPGGAVLRHFGFARFYGNPTLCENCISQFRKAGVFGAEIPLSMLFADIRGSTGIGERMRPAAFRKYLADFYKVGSDVIFRHEGLVDKFVGDEVIGLFFGGITGPAHAAEAVAAAIELGAWARQPDASVEGPVPLGVAVHTGEAYVGTTGPEGAVDDFTALGDAVNTTARLASSAAAGEVIVSVAAAEAAGRAADGVERRTLDLRGRHETVDVFVFAA